MKKLFLLHFLLFTGLSFMTAHADHFPERNKLLIVSNISTNFHLYLGTERIVQLHNHQLNPLVLRTAAQAFNQKFSVVGTTWQSFLPTDIESSASTWKRAIIGSFSQGLIGNDRSLDDRLFLNLRKINRKYRADYIALIHGEGRLTSALIKSNTGPTTFAMEIYLIDAQNGDVVSYQNGVTMEEPYSSELNAVLFDSLQTQAKVNAQYKVMLIRWINSQAPRLTREIAIHVKK